ncbi:DMT family transporter [Agrococcus jenensis]|uniref:Drug/metabolite transporter (DMT)-like permease n=1 Tax=Agrococcus jenensis TaxID=46353 RepID=A0A3N2AVU7_9MICO|nr:DMT family transporter [Agrococcus jenensis]ROR67153.1 drug/metabolite transporter (DMT)-like permease [Agrococcus jenensis]
MTSQPAHIATASGTLWGLSGVVAFSFTVIFTRIAVDELDPLFVGAARAVVAAAIAGAVLVATRQRLPSGAQWARLAIVAGGVVVGFPLLTSYALTTAPASHGAIVIALLPAATAIAAVLRLRERPGVVFWIAAAVGAVAAAVFASLGNGGFGTIRPSDVLLLAAVAAAAIGYAEGGVLSRELGAWQTISWALVVVSPLTICLTAASATIDPPHAGASSWLALAYLAIVSMFLGFIAWYRGLAIGPMTQVSQLQLVQPVLTLAWAAVILGEPLSLPTVLGGVTVIACAAVAVRARQRPLRAQVAGAGRDGRPLRHTRSGRPVAARE